MRQPPMKVLKWHLSGLLICAGILLSNSAQALFHYTVITHNNVKVSGTVTAGNLRWNCSGKQCKISGNWPTPGVSACHALALKIGQIKRYGHPGKQLDAQQLKQCNQSVPAIMTAHVALLAKAQPNYRVIAQRGGQSAQNASNDEEASGPDLTQSAVNLMNELDSGGGNVESDFNNVIPWSHRLIPDKSAPEVFYYFPKEYVLVRKLGTQGGLQLKFSYGYASPEGDDDFIKMEFELGVPYFSGAATLLEKLSAQAIRPSNGKPVKLRSWPITSVTVKLDGLEAFVDGGNIEVINTPQHTGDSIRAIVSMSESTKEEVVGAMRNLGVGGTVIITAGDTEMVIPLTISFREYSGRTLTSLKNVGPGHPVQNLGPFPVKLKGIVGYVQKDKGLKRHYKSFKSAVIIPPRAKRPIGKKPADVFGKNTVLVSWFDYEPITDCQQCLNTIEKEVLLVAGLTSKENLVVEAMPSMFADYGIFKIIVEVESLYLESGSPSKLVKTFSLRENQPVIEAVLYLDRDLGYEVEKFRYRFRPILADSDRPTEFSAWRSSSTVDITLTPSDIRTQIE